VCPYLMWSDKRAKGAAVARPQVHADIDHGHLDGEKVRAIDGFAVASGTPGNGHVYVALTESVPAHWHRALCRGLGDYLGGADAKISENDVLRPPGTLNHKPTAAGGDPAVVTWLVPPNGVRVDPHTLAHQLGVTLPEETVQTNGHAGHEVEQVTLDHHPTVRAALERNTGDRSEDTIRVVGASVSDYTSIQADELAEAIEEELLPVVTDLRATADRLMGVVSRLRELRGGR
jgi:hypothetical protein